jgi:hypothetical protein
MRKYLVIFIFVFSLLPGVICTANIFTGPGTDWFNNANWDPATPGAIQDAEMSVDGTSCIVVAPDNITCRGLYVGAIGGINQMFMEGGDITCTWLNVGRGADPNNSKGEGTFVMTGGTINTTNFKIPEQFNSNGNYMTRGIAQVHGGTIDVSTANFGVGDRIHGLFAEGFGTLELKPGAQIIIASNTITDPIEDDLYSGYITAVPTDPNAVQVSAAVIVDVDDVAETTTLSALDTTDNQAYDPVPGSWATEEYTVSSQTTELDWSTATGGTVFDEFLFFSEDKSLVVNKSLSVRSSDLVNAPRPHSVGSLELGETYYWQIETNVNFTKYDGQIWSLRIPRHIRVDNFDGYTGVWTDSGSATSAVEDNAGLLLSPAGNNLKITVGAGQTGSVSSAPLGNDWTVKAVKGLYVDVYGNDLNDPGVTLTATLNGTASVVFSESLDTVFDESLNQIFTWKIPVEDFGIDMSNITQIAFSVDNSSGAGDAVVHVANIRLVPLDCVNQPASDVNGDCVADLSDLGAIATDWLTDGLGLPD